MATISKPDAVRFIAEGRVVIPAWRCRKIGIRGRTQAVVEATPDGVLIRPVTCRSIARLHGSFQRDRKPCEPSLAEEWAEHKREEMTMFGNPNC